MDHSCRPATQRHFTSSCFLPHVNSARLLIAHRHRSIAAHTDTADLRLRTDSLGDDDLSSPQRGQMAAILAVLETLVALRNRGRRQCDQRPAGGRSSGDSIVLGKLVVVTHVAAGHGRCGRGARIGAARARVSDRWSESAFEIWGWDGDGGGCWVFAGWERRADVASSGAESRLDGGVCRVARTPAVPVVGGGGDAAVGGAVSQLEVTSRFQK